MPSITNSGDENWTFKHEVDYIFSFWLQNCFDYLSCSNEFSSHDIVLYAKWHVKAFPVPLFSTNRLLEQIHKNLKFKAMKLSDFKMDLIKWQSNFLSCNFGLKSYLWFQIELALRARSILKSREWFQTKLHSSQFNYHYKVLNISSAKGVHM